jgi:hypothetical protein
MANTLKRLNPTPENVPMNSSSVRALITACLIFGATRSQAVEWQTVKVTVPKGDKMAIRIPATWKQMVLQPKPELPPSVMINTADNGLLFQLTFLPDPDGRFATKESVEKTVAKLTEQYVAGSVEKRLAPLTPIVSSLGHGC